MAFSFQPTIIGDIDDPFTGCISSCCCPVAIETNTVSEDVALAQPNACASLGSNVSNEVDVETTTTLGAVLKVCGEVVTADSWLIELFAQPEASSTTYPYNLVGNTWAINPTCYALCPTDIRPCYNIFTGYYKNVDVVVVNSTDPNTTFILQNVRFFGDGDYSCVVKVTATYHGFTFFTYVQINWT